MPDAPRDYGLHQLGAARVHSIRQWMSNDAAQIDPNESAGGVADAVSG
jgi:hypothetical protein